MLETFRLVPDDAAVFDLCRQGNLPGSRSLLSQGHAAVRFPEIYTTSCKFKIILT